MVTTPSFEPVAPVPDFPSHPAPYKFQRSNVGARQPSQRQYTAQSASSSPFDFGASDDRLPNLLQRADKQLALTLLRQIDVININRDKLENQLAFDLVRSIRGYEDLSNDDIEYILTPDGLVADVRKSLANPTVLKLLTWPRDANLCSACSSTSSCRPTSLNTDQDPALNTVPQRRSQCEVFDDLEPFKFCVHCYLGKKKHTLFTHTRELKKWHYPTADPRYRADPKHEAHMDGCGTTGSWLVAVCGCSGCDHQNTFEDADAFWDHMSKHHSKLDPPKLGNVKHEPDLFSLKLMIRRLVAWQRYAPIWNEISGGHDVIFRHQPQSTVKGTVLELLHGPEDPGNGWNEERNAWSKTQLLKLHDGLVQSTLPRNLTVSEQVQTLDALAQKPTYTAVSNSIAIAPGQEQTSIALAHQPTDTSAFHTSPPISRSKGKGRLKNHRNSHLLARPQSMRKSSPATTSEPESLPEQSSASPGPCDISEIQPGPIQIYPDFSLSNNIPHGDLWWEDFGFPPCPELEPDF